MSGTIKFPPTDWRFNEFPNLAAHTLHITCVELLALPVAPDVVTNNLLDVVAKGYTNFLHLKCFCEKSLKFLMLQEFLLGVLSFLVMKFMRGLIPSVL